jgi:hypothetical protein
MAQINKPNEYFNTVLYTGDGSSPRSLTGVNFQPDWVWLKRRNDAASHTLYDVVRTAGSTKGIATNSTVEEGLTASEGTTANFGYINSFDSDGFSVTTGASSDGYVNNSSDTYVAWNWLGGGTGVSNTDGDITSTVSANTTSGFSVVSYTGNGTNGATIGHGLGVAPKMVIPKCRSDAGDWSCYHASLSASNNIFLNLTQAQSAIVDRDNGGISTTSSTTFTVAQGGSTLNNVNGSGRTYIAYCFAEKKGFSKFGSYTGNGNADGTFIYTGFKPAFVICKMTSGSGQNWELNDNKRNPYNEAKNTLRPNTADAEDGTFNTCDLLSNGFKLRTSNDATNQSSATYIYMAFAENPLVGTNNIPATAR